ncbi:hypothetical protein ACHQM5_000899 [Ranunculus cassubicifolius]
MSQHLGKKVLVRNCDLIHYSQRLESSVRIIYTEALHRKWVKKKRLVRELRLGERTFQSS